MNCLRTTIINNYDVLKWKVKIADVNIMCGKEPLFNYYYAAAIITGE